MAMATAVVCRGCPHLLLLHWCGPESTYLLFLAVPATLVAVVVIGFVVKKVVVFWRRLFSPLLTPACAGHCEGTLQEAEYPLRLASAFLPPCPGETATPPPLSATTTATTTINAIYLLYLQGQVVALVDGGLDRRALGVQVQRQGELQTTQST